MIDTKKKDILEDVKEVDRRVRAKIVYDKIGKIKEWAKEVASLKEKTQVMLEELGVETADIKRLIDYATNSPEAQLTDADKKEIRDGVKEEVKEGREKVQKKVLDSTVFLASGGLGTQTIGTGGTAGTGWGDTTTTNTFSTDDGMQFAMKR